MASKGNVPVASILTLSFKKSMVYKYGCSDAAFHNLGGTSLLFSRAIQEAKESGFEEFEMGRSDTANTGLIAFKEHWGAKGTAIRYWRYPAPARCRFRCLESEFGASRSAGRSRFRSHRSRQSVIPAHRIALTIA